MTTEQDIDNLLLRWQELHRLGETPSLDELCRACPEHRPALEKRIENLEHIGSASTLQEPGARKQPAAEHWPSVKGYEVLEELGRGGMGVVYRARQLGADRTVALKMLSDAGPLRPRDLARFRTEARLLASLHHPNFVLVYEVGEQEGQPFFSMEYVAGGSLSRRLRAHPLPAAEAARLVETLARAIHAAHQRNILHRDLKPSNVLLALDGTPKIADFGLAKELEKDVGQTPSGTILGTPSYMAPEQAGARKDVGPTADVYSLGAILYELLTGRPPFRGETPLDTLVEVMSREPRRPSAVRPGVPRELEAVCLKCLEKQPGRRYATAAALADDLARWGGGEAPLASAAVTERLTAPPRRSWGKYLVLLLLVALFGGFAARLSFPDPPRSGPPDALLRGRPVTLVPATGPPASYRLLEGEGNASASKTRREPFTVGTFGLALVELRPQLPIRRYRLELEVLQEDQATVGQVGFYFACRPIETRQGRDWYFYRVVFAERLPGGERMPPRLELCRFARKGARGPMHASLWLRPSEAMPAPVEQVGAKPAWRKLAVDVAPEGITLWEGQKKLAVFSLKDLALQVRLWWRLRGPGGEQPLLPVRGGLGLYVSGSSASFRSVIVTPAGAAR
jgi:serine/threonine-protein kinase